jgi:hypothetical protein
MKEIRKQIKGLAAGDLVCVEWCDASIGKSLSNGLSGIDVPVKSWGVFIDILGQKRKHIILAQNCFRYSDGLYDIDYTAVPVLWITNAAIISKGHVTAALERFEALGLTLRCWLVCSTVNVWFLRLDVKRFLL